jgi:hypothetical protein
MPLTSGSCLGPYEILAPLGAGGTRFAYAESHPPGIKVCSILHGSISAALWYLFAFTASWFYGKLRDQQEALNVKIAGAGEASGNSSRNG